jgi:branched-chain amino acid aminotransferase
LIKAIKENRVIEAFGAGTAAVVSPVKNLSYKGEDFKIPINEKIHSGELAARFMKEITEIQSGVKKFGNWVTSI